MSPARFATAALVILSLAAHAQPVPWPGPPPRPFASAGMPGASVEVPMLEDGEVAVEVRINGKGPYRFLLDTGAAGGGRVSSSLVGTLGLKTVAQAVAGDPMNKNTRTIDIVEADSLTIGEAVFRGVHLGVRDFAARPGVDGVLGIGLFEDFLLTLDYPRQRVRMEKGGLPADGKGVLAFEDPQGIPRIRMKVGDQDVAVDVDSGNRNGEIVLPASYIGKVPLEKEPVVVGRGRTGYNEFEIKQAPLKGVLQIGGQTVEQPLIDFIEGFPNGNLGRKFLRRFAVSIDQKNHRIRFEPPAKS